MERSRLGRLLVRCCLGLVVVICLPNDGFGQNRERQQIMADVRMLHEQTMRLQLHIATLDESLRVLTEQLKVQAEATVRAFADHRLLVDEVAGVARGGRQSAGPPGRCRSRHARRGHRGGLRRPGGLRPRRCPA